jgi:hypothetical protein
VFPERVGAPLPSPGKFISLATMSNVIVNSARYRCGDDLFAA